MSPRRVLDAIIITSVGVLCAAFVLGDLSLGIGAAIVGAAAVILDDVTRN
jgi:serine acetyltransferase